MMKILNKLGVEGNIFNLIKDIYKKPTDNIILNDESIQSTLTTSIQHCIECLSQAN